MAGDFRGTAMRHQFGAVALAMAVPLSAQAGTLLTTDAGYGGRSLDLSAFANGSYNYTLGPIDVDGLTFTAAPGGNGSTGQGAIVGQGNYWLGSNGFVGGDAVYIGLDSEKGYADLIGQVGYSEIGFFMSYFPGFGDDATISTLDASGNVIESFNIAFVAPIVTSGALNEFAFRGIRADVPDSIYGLRFGGNYIALTGTIDGVPVAAAVPDAPVWTMMVFGFALAGGAMRVRTRKIKFAYR